MKNILLACFIFLITSAFGQENSNNGDTIKVKIIGVNDSIRMQLVKHYKTTLITTPNGSVIFAHYYLRWNSNQDSIPIPVSSSFVPNQPYYLPRFLPLNETDTCEIFLKQLDKQGLNEVIIEHSKNNSITTTIVNLDSSKIIFCSTNSQFVYYPLNTHYGDDHNNYSSCKYSYEISFDNSNNLIIHSLKQRGGLNPNPKKQRKGKRDYVFGCDPDKKEGVYVLQNGIYTYSEEKSKEIKKQ